MSTDTIQPSRGGHRRRGNRRRGNFRGRRSESRTSGAPAKKSGGILGFIKRLFGFGSKPAARPEFRSRDDRPPRDERRPRTEGDRPERSKALDIVPEVNGPKLYVGNLAYEVSESDLFDLFSKVGAVKNAEIVRDRNMNSKGFGFVEMESLESAKAASDKYHKSELMGRQLIVSGAKS
jgi:RNA recognition motif-containing protein